MTRRYKILVCGLCGVIAIIAVWFFCLRESEPSYNGRTLSEWLDRFENPVDTISDDSTDDEPEKEKARKAVLEIGTNGLPCLVKWIDPKQSNLRRKAVDWAYEISWTTGRRFVIRLLADRTSDKTRNLARIGFEILGTNAAPSVGELIDIMNKWKGVDVPTDMAEVVATIGPVGIRALAMEADKERAPHRRIAIEVLDRRGHRGDTNVVVAIPVLLKIAEATNDPCSEWAIVALRDVRGNPKEVVPVLTRIIERGDEMSAWAAYGLCQYGADAKEAVPALQAMARNDKMRNTAETILKVIAPNSATADSTVVPGN